MSLLRISMLAAACGLLLQSCSSVPEQNKRPRLADLPAFDRSMLSAELSVSEQQLDLIYQQILSMQPAEQTRKRILYRLSQMHTSQLEQSELPTAQEQVALRALVQRYEQLLRDYPQEPNNELIRYQLARSYDLLAEQNACLQQLDILLRDYPSSPFASEVWFRKADIHYSFADYEAALAAYLAVLNGTDPTLQQHARYMAGWSYFKLQQFEQADEQFLHLLDDTYTELLLTENTQPQQSLRSEVLRTLSISLSYQQQGESLQALLQRVPYRSGERSVVYVAELYQTLARFLAEKQLLSESLHSYRLFIQHYPATITAAEFQLLLIEHYLASGEADLALSAQQEYISLFGPGSAFWQQARSAELAQVQPLLLQYLDYFARAHYARATALQGEDRTTGFAAAIPLWQNMLTVLQQTPNSAYPQADTSYPQADISYLLAESYAGAGQHAAALELYTWLGYQAPLTDASLFTAQDAAYKALLLSEQLSSQSDAAALALWQQQSRFVAQHCQHPAAQQVALQQLQQRYREQDYQAVLLHSADVINWGGNIDNPATQNSAAPSQRALVQEAQFLQSQSELALKQYAAAEQSINALLQQQLPAQRRELLTAQLASSIYQQAQQKDVSLLAVQAHLQRLLSALPQSEYHEAAAYQQIELQLAARDYPAAITLLNAFIQRYPGTERTTAAKALLLDSYEQAEQWDNAAQQLMTLTTTGDTQQQREALYLAAQYYQRANHNDKALDAWRSYANRYPKPHLLAQEARYQLVQLYQQQRDLSRQNFWREKIASFEQQFASEGNERTRQLAAQVLLQLGQHESSLFAAIRLSHPLRQSLQQKRQHMSGAIKHYEQAISYGVASLVSEAQFRVAELYQQMATALLQSDRPKGLDELALEEYELLLEEQAFPFEEQAIAIYQQNTRLTQQQVWDNWVQQSFIRLAQLLPAKFNKTEAYTGVADAAD
ncbi:outer membrane protein assembly factor BamD (BamD/ComL family) [Rheinheimera pacifica]|uniref:tetratricopeptide repeat protein n=1 Tax=Rheinheimera pacifica TaxID=173990 RepID=UPI0028639FB8|nr:tetratricopeptide repeat protein [Rheinheimera pacifica]MDR6985275.1 outer membrane protein assembly factor BamD (BamD/ComL family) [Rheinheimera pacifica]